MQKPLVKSIIFHLIVTILLVASSWSIFSRHEKIPDIKPITIQLAPMGEKTNLKPAPKREVTPPKPKTEKSKPKPEETEPMKPKPKKTESKKPEVKKPDPKKPEPKKEEKKKDELQEMLEKLDKTEKKKDEKKNDELSDMLKDLDKTKTESKTSDAKDTNPDSKSDQPFDPNSPETLAVVDYITKLIVDQIKVCWSPPAGIRDAQNMASVRVNVDISPDGTIKFVGFDGGNNNPAYQVASDAARRAVLDPECNPLRVKPPADKYYIWKEMTLTFNPRDLIY